MGPIEQVSAALLYDFEGGYVLLPTVACLMYVVLHAWRSNSDLGISFSRDVLIKTSGAKEPVCMWVGERGPCCILLVV